MSQFERRISRRQLFKSAGLGAIGLSGAALLGCGSSGKKQETAKPLPTQESIPTIPNPETQPAEKQFLFPASVAEIESDEPNWKNVNIKLGISNNTDEVFTIGSLTNIGPATLTTADGYTYNSELSSIVGYFTDKGYSLPILPPGFMARFLAGLWFYDQIENPPLLSYSFRIPKSIPGNYKLSITGIPPEFDLAKVKANPHYPTERPDSDFMEVGNASVLIPQPQNDDGKSVKLTFDSLTPVIDPNLLNPEDPYKLYSLKGTAENQSKGYSALPVSESFENVFIVGDDGGIYLGQSNIATGGLYLGIPTSPNGVPFVGAGLNPRSKETILYQSIDPGITIEFEIGILVAKMVSKAKLILPGLNDAILNLHLNPDRR